MGRFATHKESSIDPTVREWVSANAIEHTVKVCTLCNGAMQRDIEDPARSIARPLLTHLLTLWPPHGRDLAWPPARSCDEVSLRWLSKGGEVRQRPPRAG